MTQVDEKSIEEIPQCLLIKMDDQRGRTIPAGGDPLPGYFSSGVILYFAENPGALPAVTEGFQQEPVVRQDSLLQQASDADTPDGRQHHRMIQKYRIAVVQLSGGRKQQRKKPEAVLFFRLDIRRDIGGTQPLNPCGIAETAAFQNILQQRLHIGGLPGGRDGGKPRISAADFQNCTVEGFAAHRPGCPGSPEGNRFFFIRLPEQQQIHQVTDPHAACQEMFVQVQNRNR